MDLVKLLGRLQAISEEGKKPDADKDGVPDWADKKKGADDTEDKKSKANEDIMNVLKGLRALQEEQVEEDDVEEGNEFSGALKAAKDAGHDEFEVGGKKYKVNECGDMEMPASAMMGAEASPLTMMGADGAEVSAEPEADAGEPQIKDRFTLTITKADGSTLNATTDVPDEITALMKAIGMSAKATVAPAGEQPAGEVEEEFGNTPNATSEREPSLKGQTKDWGLPGQGAGKPSYPGTKASGDNPMAESMFKEYLNFKAGK